MRNKKLFVTIVVMLLLVFILSMALVACKKKPEDNPSDNPSGDVPPPWVEPDPEPPHEDDGPTIPAYATSFRGAMGYMVEAMPGDYLSLNFTGGATVRGKKYTMSLKGNLAENDIQVSAVFKPEGLDDVAFAIYIINSKLFIELEDGTIFNLAEIDANYLASIVDKLPDKLSKIINDLLGNYASLVPMVLDLLLEGFSPSTEIKYEDANGVETFALNLDVQGFLTPITTLLKPGGIIGMFLPEGLDISFVGELLSMIPLINGQLKATVSKGVLSEFNVELYDNDPSSPNYRQTLLGFDSAITFSSTPLALDIPDGLDKYQGVSRTLGNLNADFTLTIDTAGESFDIGALIDEFLPKPMFGEGILVLDGNADYKLDVKASLDPNLDGLAEDNNYVNAVLRAGDNELVRINYLDGKLYVKALANGINGFADGGINVAINLDLKEYISKLVDLVTKAIDGFLGTEFKPSVPSGAMLTASINENGEAILSPSLQSVIMGILKLVGFENSVELSGDKIKVIIDEALFKAIADIAKIDPIDLPIFGEVVLGLFKGGIEYVEVKAMDVLTLRADNFLIGTAKVTREDIKDSIGDVQDYGEDIKSIILSFALSMLSDLELSLDLELATENAVVNLTPVINGIMAMANNKTYLTMPIAFDLSKYNGVFKLRIATNYDSDNNVGRILLELVTPDGDILISAYNEEDSTYVDLSGLGFMKFCLTNVNLFEMIRGLLDDKEYNDDYDEEVAPVMAKAAHSSGVEIDSNYIGVAVSSYFVTMITRMFAMDLGIDVDLNAHLNFDGSVNAQLGIGNTAMFGLAMSLGKESQSDVRIKDKVAECRINEDYGVYNAIGAQMLIDSILDSQNLALTIDIYNNNCDKSTHDNKTRIDIRKSNASKPGTSETLDNGKPAPYNAIVVTIYDGWTYNDEKAMIYLVLDVESTKKNMSIYLCKTALNGISAQWLVEQFLGTINNQLSFDFDIKSTLAGLLSGIFEASAGITGGIIDVPEGALPPQKPEVVHKCKHRCEICGRCLDETCTDEVCANNRCDGVHEDSDNSVNINQIFDKIVLTLTGSMDIDVDVNLNGAVVSNLLTNLLKGVFTDMDISGFTNNEAHKHVTVDYDNKNNRVFANSLYSNLIKPLMDSFLSGVGGILDMVNLDNLVANIVARFLPLSDVQDLTANVSLTDGKLANITIMGINNPTEEDPYGYNNQGYGIYIFNRKADTEVSFEHQDTNIYFNRNFNLNLMDMFEKRARKHTRINWEVDSWENIVWTVKAGNNTVTLDNFNANLGNYADGAYVVTGTAWGETITVNLTLDSCEIDYIKDIELKAMREIPGYVTAVFSDGSERIISDVEIVCNARKNLVDEETGEPINNASVTIGGKTYEFNIEFEKEDITLDTLVLNAYDYIDVIKSLESAGTVRVKVNDGFYRNLPATYDFEAIKALKREEVQGASKHEVAVHVGAGTQYERDMILEVEFTPFDIYYIERNDLHYIETDFIEYAKGNSFPDEITVVGFNGKEYLKYTANVSKWDLSHVNIDLKGGQYFASAVINEGKYNRWVLEGIEVNVLSSDIVGLASSNKTVTLDWKYSIYGGIEIDDCITSLLNFRTSNNLIRKDVPVTIDLSGIQDNYNELFAKAKAGIESRVECPVTIDVYDEEGNAIYDATTITVIVPSIKMSLIESEITVDVSDEDFNGLAQYFKDLSKMEIKLGDEVVNANVTWVTDDVIVNQDGEYKAFVYIARGDSALQQVCEVKVKITGNNNITPTQSAEEVH